MPGTVRKERHDGRQAELCMELGPAGIPLQGDVRIVVYDHDDGGAAELWPGRLLCCAGLAGADGVGEAGDEVCGACSRRLTGSSLAL
jgi:hypothetical protein